MWAPFSATERCISRTNTTKGRCKAIGLLNVSLGQLKQVFDIARVKPAAVQVESHPYLPEWELLDYCKRNGIVMQAFAALGHGIEPKTGIPGFIPRER